MNILENIKKIKFENPKKIGNTEISLEEKIFACIILHALGDTIGYKNSEWEFGVRGNFTVKLTEKIYEFVELGGVNHVPKKGWKISDDTILHIALLKTLIECSKGKKMKIEIFNELFVKHLIKINDTEFKDPKIRNPGIATLQSLDLLKSGVDWKNIAYDKYAGGSGASMRTLCLGLYFGNNIDKLIEFSIESSRVTHNNTIGYLGGFVSAYFVNLACSKVPINLWPFKLLELLKDDSISKYIKKTRGIKEYETSHVSFVAKWDRYVKDKFDNSKKIIKRKSNKNLICRNQYYYDNFGFKETVFPGGSGDDSVIIAYDSLVDCDGIWEKLVFYSMLHSGDTDTTGCIAAGLYGSYYGFGDVNLKLLLNIEGIDHIYSLCNKLLDIIKNK